LSGSALTATLANGPANSTDWVALYCNANTPPYQDYKYLNDTRTPGSGVAAATVHFVAPAGKATCNAIWYASNTFTVLATSNTVTLPVAAPTITLAESAGILTATLANGPANTTDWVALYCPAGGGQYREYKYMSDSRTAPGSGIGSASVHFGTPSGVATCNAVWYANNS